MPYAKLFYHFVWGTKNRLPRIEAAFEPNLYRVMAEKTQMHSQRIHPLAGAGEEMNAPREANH